VISVQKIINKWNKHRLELYLLLSWIYFVVVYYQQG